MRGERALEESEALYRDLVENAWDWLWQTDDGVFTYSNPAVERVLGYRPDEVIGKYGVEFAAPEDRERVYRIYRQASRDRADVPRLMHRIIRKDGSLCWVEASARVILDDKGNAIGFRGINRDVTDRVRTEEALAKSEARYREMAEGISDWIWEIDAEGRCTYSSPAIESILGYTPEEVIGKPIVEFILPEYREEVARQMGQAVAEGREIVGSLTGEVHKDGSIRYLETNAKPVFDESGNPVGFRGMNRDVTARVEAERALEGEKQRFRGLIENASDIITVMDADGIMTYVSPAVERVLGYKPEELVGRIAMDYLHPDDLANSRRGIAAMLEREGAIVTTEFRLRRKDGDYRAFEATAQNLLALPAVRGIIFNHRDITERKRAEEALEAEKERFRALIENASDIITVMNADRVISYISPSVEPVMGYKPEEVVGRAALGDVHPDDISIARDALTAAVEHEPVPTMMQLRLRRRDGSWRMFEMTIRSLLKDPSVGGIVVNQRDITERKQAEEALKESEERFRALVENSFDITMLVDAEGNIMYISPAVERILGFTPDEMIGTPIFDLGPPDEAARSRLTFRALAKHEGMTESGREFRLRDRDGSWHIMETAAKNMLSDPAVNGIIINHRDVTERKQAEEVLQKTYEQLRTVVDTSPLGIITLDLDGKVTSWNPAAENMFGWAAQEVIGKPMPNLPDDQLPVYREFTQRLLRGEVLTGEEVQNIRKDGTRVEISVSVAALHDSTGAIVGFMGMLADITERKRAEEALAESEDKYRSLVESAVDAIVSADSSGRIVSWNKAAEAMFGYTKEEATGKPVTILMPERYRAAHIEGLERMRTGAEPRLIGRTVEFQGAKRDGREFPLELSLTTWLTPRGRSYAAIIRDITERKRAEEAVRESEAQYRQLVEMMNEGLARADRDYVFTYVNQKLADMLGYRPEEMIGRSVPEFVHEDGRSVLEDQMARRKRGEAESFELAWRSKDGRTVYTLVSPRPMFDQAGNFAGSIAALTDITERKRAEEAAQRKQQEVITLLNTVPGYVFWKDAKSVYVTANEVFARAVGVPTSDIPGKTDYDFFPRELAEKYRADDRRLVEAGRPIEIGEEETIEGPRRVTVETRKVPLKDDRGNVIGLIGIALDVTERKKAEARLRELEEHRKEFYRKTIEAATEGKLVISERDEIERMAGPPIASWEIKSGEDLSVIRQETAKIARESGMDENRICDFILAVGEATTNAYKHAGGGSASLHRKDDSFTMVVSDHGKGMEALALPEVALRRGYTTAFSLGMGYKAILAVADKVCLATGPAGTTVAVEMSLHATEAAKPEMTLPDTW